MNDIQKKLLKKLLEYSYDMGFHGFPISKLSKDCDVPEKEIYDSDSESGELAEYTQNGTVGLVYYRGGSLSINRDTLHLLENWIR